MYHTAARDGLICHLLDDNRLFGEGARYVAVVVDVAEAGADLARAGEMREESGEQPQRGPNPAARQAGKRDAAELEGAV